MKTPNALWIAAAIAATAIWILPGEVPAEDWKLRKHHAVVEESEPEVPNGAIRTDEGRVAVENRGDENRRIVGAPATRPQRWMLRALRILRSFGGPKR